MTTLHRREDHFLTFTKGAPEAVLDLCDRAAGPDEESLDADAWLEQAEQLANEGYRVLAVAAREVQDAPGHDQLASLEADLAFVGLIALIDPPRPEAPEAVADCLRAGITPVMITGDHPGTASAIARRLGISDSPAALMTGPELAAITDAEFAARVASIRVYARVSPEQKLRIVKALQDAGEFVAMTGDGVNDAPALKRSDIGVAMGVTGTDVAKETADMVLTDDNYASIVSAVEQGRIIYANIRKFVFYLLSCNLAEIAVIFLAILAGLPSPLTPIQLLWLNLITDGAPALALGMEKGDPDTMDHPPRPPREPVINRPMRVRIGIQTVAITAVTLSAYLMGIAMYPGVPEEAKTMAFVTLSFSELLRAFTARSENYPLLRIGIFSNRVMLYAVVSSLLLLLAVIYLPFLQPIFNTVALGWAEWQVVLPLLFVPAIVAELTKWVMSRRFVAAGVSG
jgi:Ca2+-transporting ATPase